MTDPFDRVTPGQRRLVFVVLAIYVALFVVELATGNQTAAAAADLLLAVLVVPASGYLLAQFWIEGSDETALLLAIASVFVSGLAIGYGGLATLDLVPVAPAVEALGTFALLIAILLYLYWQRGA